HTLVELLQLARGGADRRRRRQLDALTMRTSNASEHTRAERGAGVPASERAGGSGGSKTPRILLDFSRPFTLVAPALGFVSGAATAYGAAPREVWHTDLILYPLIGSLMAAVSHAGNHARDTI